MPAATTLLPSPVDTLLKEQTPKSSSHPDHLHQLALQILHNLQHQHRWTQLKIHTEALEGGTPLPRPMISGLPPKRLYMHPDEQAYHLKQQAQTGITERDDEDEVNPLEKPIREWVLPTHLKEKWTLGRFAEVFDALDWSSGSEEKPWEAHKRVVLATLQDDSSIVYYV